MPTTTVTIKMESGEEKELEILYEEGRLLRSADRTSPAEYAEDEIISVEHQGVDVTDSICRIYSTKELLN